MDKKKIFIEYINEKTSNKFTFLKLKNIFYDTQKNHCKIDFIYPSSNEITEEDRKKIFEIIKNYIKLDVELKVEINKSYVESDLIAKQIARFFEINHKFFFSSFDFKNLNILCEEIVKIHFNLESKLYDFFKQFNIDKKLLEYLDKNFCAEFEISTNLAEEKAYNDDFLFSRIKSIEEKSDLDALISTSQDKYFLLDKKPLVGDEITFNPRYIRTITRQFDSCVVAGKISNISERTYKKKTKKTDKNGEVIVEDKPFFNFQIKDDTGSIKGVIFPNKAVYHKMHLLKDGDTIAVQGRIGKFNDNFDIMAGKISFCTIPNKNDAVVVDQNLIADYRFVRPQNYLIERQQSLFEEKHLSAEILNNSYVVYDFETTGIDFNTEEIIEIGALKIVGGEYREVFTTLVKPSKHIPEGATKVNKITDEMVANSPSISQVIGDFYLFCKGSQLVGFNNIFFDKQFLDKASAKVGINFDNPQLDAFSLAKQKLKGLNHYNLSSVAKHLNINLTDAHRALSDVIATAEVFLKLY
ncbi:MAG: hypothetical protein EOM55_02240 [Clostridia bacterium]|nr:hypothetical protein [Clostridia bacterium]